MPGQYAYEKRRKYPHLKPQDVAIWERYIAANPMAYEGVDYDVAVGDSPRFSTEVNPETGGDDRFNYRRKIDVVGYVAGRVEIVEIKPQASPSAFGQVLGYLQLYKSYVDPEANAKAVIITDHILPDMPHLAYMFGVELRRA